MERAAGNFIPKGAIKARRFFLSYIGFDSVAANSAEAIDPEKTMPRGIIGSLLIAVLYRIPNKLLHLE